MKIKKTILYKWLKRSPLIFFAKYKLTDRDYLQQKKILSQSSFKSKELIKQEMDLCHDYWHCDPVHYIRYGLFEKNLSNEELLDYIPPYYHYNFYMSAKYKGIDTSFYGNKLNLYHLFVDKGIPTPEVMAVVSNRKLKDVSGNEMHIQNFCNALKREKKYFFKPTDGQGGTGIRVFTLKEETECVFAELTKFLKYLKRNKTYIVQEGVDQHYDFQIINSSSVNTLRMITQRQKGQFVLSACVLRIGRKGKDIDNSHQGGMSVQIDINTGKFNPIAMTEHGGCTFTEHPDSGFIFEGHKVADWDKIKSSIIYYASLFPELKEIGWDIAITISGINVIELNLGYGLDHLQVCCGGMRRKLNIYSNN